jgi:hypothetical protein
MSTLITRSMQLLRYRDAGNKKRFLNVVDTCNAFSSVTKLKYIFNGRQFVKYSSHGEILNAWVESERHEWGSGSETEFMMVTDDKNDFFSLGPLIGLNDPDINGIEFSFNIEKPLLKPEGFISFRDCKEFFIACINSYEAYTAFIHDSDLEKIVSFGYVNRVIKAQIPKELWKDIPTPDVVENLPASLAERLSNVHSPDEFDRLEIPEAIYWFNYWNPYMVEHVGEDKIRQAPCEVIEKQNNGGYTLIVQKENFDSSNIEHLERLAKVYDYFNLYELQQKHFS